jgi:hypothetical protein
MVFTWIEIAVLYLLGMGLFMWLGGIAAAADALSRWGRATTERGRTAVSSSF